MSRPSVFCSKKKKKQQTNKQTKNVNAGHCTQPFQPHCAITVMLMGTINFCNVASLSLTFNLARDYKVSPKQNRLA